MTIQEMKEKKREYGLTNAQIAELSGLPEGTVRKVFSGETTSPRAATIEALLRVFVRPHAPALDSPYAGFYDVPSEAAEIRRKQLSQVREPGAVYAAKMMKKQGEFTVEDYLAIPDERRCELIDGVLYDMGAPTSIHQLIAGLLHARLLSYIQSKGGSCVPFVSPIDVQLDRDEWTMVQPDVIIVCDRDQITPARILGAPDFLVEILSKSTRAKDIFLKGKKYVEAGVREYWVVDPDRKAVTVFLFEEKESAEQNTCTVEDDVPVAIYGGDCVISFSEIYSAAAFLYEKL